MDLIDRKFNLEYIVRQGNIWCVSRKTIRQIIIDDEDVIKKSYELTTVEKLYQLDLIVNTMNADLGSKRAVTKFTYK